MRSLIKSVLVIGALIAPFSSQAQQKQHHNDAFINGAPDEGRIIKEVRHQLVMLPYYSIFDDLGFRVDGGTVTLEGAVVNPVLKRDAEGVVKRVEGVTNVVNDIEVLPLSPMDGEIRRAAARTIYGDAQIGDRYGNQALPPIHILVKNGNLTLEGVVANTFDKNLINVRANSIPNVFHVTDNLVVENTKH